MTYSGHTPGKWEVDNSRIFPIVTAKNGKELICSVKGETAAQSDENARLIAAAPDLLTALQELYQHAVKLDLQHPRYERAKKAIARATGKDQ